MKGAYFIAFEWSAWYGHKCIHREGFRMFWHAEKGYGRYIGGSSTHILGNFLDQADTILV